MLLSIFVRGQQPSVACRVAKTDWRIGWNHYLKELKKATTNWKKKMSANRDNVRFDGRVAIVTGAGGGLGKSYAMLLASRGASVVVNDLGGSRSGEGKSSKAADLVVDEIRKQGGKAVANYDSVEFGDKLVNTALENFGRIDIVINNAGILRDKSFVRTSDNDWDLVHAVHLKGAFSVTRAAWPHMKKQGYGRIVMTASVAGIYGNFGQANYSSAKLGLVGLSNTLAIEGERAGIKCNVILPMATSRLTQDIFPPDLLETLKPDLIAPVVAFLCHEDCDSNGDIIEAAGGWAGKYRWQRSQGALLMKHLSQGVSIESVRDNWSKIIEMEGGDFPTSNQEATMELVGKLRPLTEEQPDNEASQETKSLMNFVGFESEPFEFHFTAKEVILYALGVGASTTDGNGLDLLYEGAESFSALTSFGVIPAMGGLTGLVSGQVPGLNIDLSRVLHGEQYTELLADKFPTEGVLRSTFKITAILDKGSGAVYVLDILSKNKATDEAVVRNQISIFVVGSGGFNGPRQSDQVVETQKKPDRKPDHSTMFKTSLDQAALYRLSGDTNPLHIDPGFAQISGFEKPILHGLCTEGIATREITKVYCSENASKIRAVKARFAKPVFPGQTIRTDMWREGNFVLFECTVVETGKQCLTGGWIKLDQDSKSSDAVATANMSLKTDVIFEGMKQKVTPELSKKVNAIFRWIITTSEGATKTAVAQWVVDLKNGGVYKEKLHSASPKADCTLTLSERDLISLAEGKLKPQTAFMQGKLKVSGNIMLTQKLQTLISNETTAAKL